MPTKPKSFVLLLTLFALPHFLAAHQPNPPPEPDTATPSAHTQKEKIAPYSAWASPPQAAPNEVPHPLPHGVHVNTHNPSPTDGAHYPGVSLDMPPTSTTGAVHSSSYPDGRPTTVDRDDQ